jgi:hypothetical protein
VVEVAVMTPADDVHGPAYTRAELEWLAGDWAACAERDADPVDQSWYGLLKPLDAEGLLDDVWTDDGRWV